MKEKYEMTFNQYVEDYINNSKYGKKNYETLTQKGTWDNFKDEKLFQEWHNSLLQRAEEGFIPEVVIRSLVNIVGEESVRRTFRGTKEKGLYLWEQTQIKKVLRKPCEWGSNITA